MNGIQLARLLKPGLTVIAPSESGDFYDPALDVIRLSEGTWYGTTPEDLARAAHECGHAMQRHMKTFSWQVWRQLPWTAPLWWVFVGASFVAGIIGDMGRAWAFAAVAILLSAFRWLVVLGVEREASVLALRKMQGIGAPMAVAFDLMRVKAVLRWMLEHELRAQVARLRKKTYAVR